MVNREAISAEKFQRVGILVYDFNWVAEMIQPFPDVSSDQPKITRTCVGITDVRLRILSLDGLEAYLKFMF